MKNKSSAKKIRINFRVTKSQFNEIKSAANSNHIPMSKFLRFMIFKVSEYQESVHQKRIDQQRAITFNDKLHDLERKYQGLGENLNQAMKQCYIYGLDQGYDELLQYVKQAISEVKNLDNDVQQLKH